MSGNRRVPVIRHAVDTDGEPIVYITLARGQEVKLLVETYDWLQAAGYSMRWTTLGKDSYVIVASGYVKGGNLAVARIITGAGARQIVRYNDRDRLNLRRDNLRLETGYAKRCDLNYSPSMGRKPPVISAGVAVGVPLVSAPTRGA